MTSQNIDNTHKRREKLSTIILDLDFLEDSKILSIRAKFGELAALWYLQLINAIAKEGGELANALVPGIAFKCGQKQDEFIENFIAECIRFELVYKTSTGLRSARLDKDIEAIAKKRDKWRTDKGFQRGTIPDSATLSDDCPSGQPSGIQTESASCQNTENRTKNSEDLKKEWSAPEPKFVDPPEPPFFGYLKIQDADREAFIIAHSPGIFRRACDLANAHIGKFKGTWDFQRELKKAQNGGFYIRGWPLKQALIDSNEVKISQEKLKKVTQKPPDKPAGRPNQESKPSDLEFETRKDSDGVERVYAKKTKQILDQIWVAK